MASRTHRHSTHKWTFKPRFRRGGFGWRSQPAIQRVREAVSEIKKVARKAPVLAAEGAVSLLERISPALEHVDSSSGAIGTAVNNAITTLVPLIANAPANETTREAWLERLWEAHAADQIPYIESLGDHWGELCATQEIASAWADRLFDATRRTVSSRGEHFHGAIACLSALYHAERYAQIVDLVAGGFFWPYKRWAVKALAAMDKPSEAIRYAESCRGPWTPDADVDALCEEILLASGLADEAYRRYALTAHRRGTYLATFRAVVRMYPHKSPAEILADLVDTTPGDEGKWFTAAKEAGLFDEALDLASRTPCDPKTLTRAARDFAHTHPAFAVAAGVLALRWLVDGYGYEITTADARAAYSSTMAAAEQAGTPAETRERVRELVASSPPGGFVRQTLGREFGL